jgi:hypothetical protein
MSPQLSLTWTLIGTKDCRLFESTRGRLTYPSVRRSQAQNGVCMRIVYQRCCGMDVHKDRVTVCLLIIEDDGEVRTEKRQFGTMTRHLEEMASWLEKQEVICCSMVF